VVTVTLTVRFAAGSGDGTFTRRLYVSPLARLEPGQQVEVAYDPADPADFVPSLA
jgi:hypothetical protein